MKYVLFFAPMCPAAAAELERVPSGPWTFFLLCNLQVKGKERTYFIVIWNVVELSWNVVGISPEELKPWFKEEKKRLFDLKRAVHNWSPCNLRELAQFCWEKWHKTAESQMEIYPLCPVMAVKDAITSRWIEAVEYLCNHVFG